MSLIENLEVVGNLKTVLDNYEEDKIRGHNRDYTELEDKQSKRNYEKLCARIKNAKVPNPFAFSFERARLKEIKNVLELILVKVLGEKHRTIIGDFVRMIKVNSDIPNLQEL